MICAEIDQVFIARAEQHHDYSAEVVAHLQVCSR